MTTTYSPQPAPQVAPSPSAEELWQQSLQLLTQRLDAQTIQQWFQPLRCGGFGTGSDAQGTFRIFYLYAPDRTFCQSLTTHYAQPLLAVLREVMGADIEPVLDVEPQPEGTAGLGSKQPTAPQLSPKMQTYSSALSAALRFETFFESACNREALRIAEATAARPGQEGLNFLFIYGPSGVGKTHLCQAIGQRAMELHSSMRVCYVACSKFQMQYMRDSLNGPGRGRFIDFYQQMDILIIDDIQGLIGKEKTQQAFFDIFNHLTLLGKQIIVTSDVPPIDLQGMETRILTRMQSAMMLHIDRPDLELRRKILMSRVAESGVQLGEECMEFIAENMKSNIREIEGAARTLITRARYSDRPVDLATTREVVGSSVNIQRLELTPSRILDCVCRVYAIEAAQLKVSSRKAELALPRQVVMYLVKKHTDSSYKAIAKLLNRKDHTTIMHGVKSIEGRLEIEAELRERVRQIEAELLGQ